MAALMTFAGLTQEANNLKEACNGEMTLHLFQNNVAVGYGDTIATYTEATFDGYAPILLPAGSVAFNAGPNDAAWSWPMQTFTMTGSHTPNNIYGYYVTMNDLTTATPSLYFSENFSPGLVMNAPGDAFSITPEVDRVHG
jgi:hypothetical protein